MWRQAWLLAGGLICSCAVQAEGRALGLHAGLMGIGVDGYRRLNDTWVLHGAYNRWDYHYDTREEDIHYDATYGLDNLQLGLDWYPAAGRFRVSAALVANANELTLDAVARGPGYEINGEMYSAAEVGDLRGSVEPASTGAYVGVGWGNPLRREKGLGVVLDIGLVYAGSADVELKARCGALAGPSRCAELQADADAERRELEDSLGDVPFWPLVQIGLSYSF